ncbi:SphA family protein [Desulfotignum balticum]|uniref:SphA family protein n=1 Tax=Desulfotignum balticum TaxID=115781 RepID=UPI000428E534|nr:transporter [Desulfotignum balticum]
MKKKSVQRMKKTGGAFLILLILLCTTPSAIMANHQNPTLNWGSTDFLDALNPGYGWIFNPKTLMYSGEFKDGNGQSLPGDNELDLVAFIPQLIYIPKLPLPYNLKFGVQALMPIVSLNVNSDIGLNSDSNLIGDLCAGPFIGSSIPLAKDWAFHWFAEFDVYAPTGSYDQNAAINPGANFWTFEPFIAMTLQMPHGFEFSTRQHYTWNSKNKDYMNPAITGDFNEHDLEPGDLWHFNWSFSKSLDFIDPRLRLGVVGYYGKQLTNDQIDGVDIPNSKEKVFAIGPGIGYVHTPEGAKKPPVIFSLKAYWESGVENRTEGRGVFFRTIIPF